MFGSYLSKRLLSGSLAVLGLAVFSGCPDPQGRFDEFVERSAVGGGGTGGDGPSEGAILTGKFFLAAAVTLNPGAPLLFEARVEMNEACPGEGCMISTFQVQPLANKGSPRKPCPEHLDPVGPVIEISDIPVEADGTFRAVFSRAAVGTVDGCANPISGSDIEATLELVASTRSEDLFCGPLDGSLFRPFAYNLNGSTFGAVRIGDLDDDSVTVKNAGIEAVLECPPLDGEGGSGGGGGGGGEGGAGGDGAGGAGGAGGDEG